MVLRYLMQAKENYDPALVAEIAAATQPLYCYLDQQQLGLSFDHVRRRLVYIATIATAATLTNDTGFNLWDGLNYFAPGVDYDAQTNFNYNIAFKHIDTEAVTFKSCWSAANLVPAGIGGGDGTWRRRVSDSSVFGGSVPCLVNPRNGDVWVHAQSCNLYLFRAADDFTQVISPLRPVGNVNNPVQPIGITDDWVYAWEQYEFTPATHASKLYLVPAAIEADEVSADELLAYATFDYPAAITTARFRQTLDHAGNVYVLAMQKAPAARGYQLFQFTPPSSAPYGGTTVGGGFTEITPWASGTGPNAHAAGYLGFLNDGNLMYFLPATNELACVCKFLDSDRSTFSVFSQDPANTFFDCVYVDLAGSTFDYHHAFVTGYMTAAWAPTADPAAAAFVVIDCREHNLYLGANSYDFGIDYTRRWLSFTVQPVVAGAWTPDDTTNRVVLVEYQFVSGSPPAVLRVIDEAGWDAAYAAYGTAIGDPEVVAASMTLDANETSRVVRDSGVYDPQSGAFWWSGATENMYHMDPAFEPRAGAFSGNQPRPPLLKLFFGLKRLVQTSVRIGLPGSGTGAPPPSQPPPPPGETPPPPQPPPPPPPEGAILVTPSTFAARLAASAAGDVLYLAPGTYPPMTFWGFQRSADVTICGQPGVVTPWIAFDTARHVRLTRITVNSLDGGQYAIAVLNSQDVTLDAVTGVGSGYDGTGVFLRRSDRVTVTGCTFSGYGSGMIPLSSTHVTIADNEIADIGDNFIFFNLCTDLDILRNRLTNPAGVSDGQHRDCIQGASAGAPDAGGPTRSARVNIRNNLFMRLGGLANCQGPGFVSDTDDLNIENGASHGSMFNGIQVSRCNRVLIANNHIQGRDDADAQGNAGTGSSILGRGNSDTVEWRDNKAPYIGYLTSAGDTVTNPTPVGAPDPSGAPANLLGGLNGNALVANATGPTDTAALQTFLNANPTTPRIPA